MIENNLKVSLIESNNDENFNPIYNNIRDSNTSSLTNVSVVSKGLRLEVRNLCYSVSQSKALLHNVSFFLDTRNMCALMGN